MISNNNKSIPSIDDDSKLRKKSLSNTSSNDIRNLFRVCDLDGSGDIDRYELAQICPHLNQDEIDSVFKDLDKNNDGLISFTEFCQGFRELLPINYFINDKETSTLTNVEKTEDNLFYSLDRSFKSLSW
jgi:hypothetical protein